MGKSLCPSNVYPLIPHFYEVKLGFTGGIPFFLLFLLQNIDCRYSLDPLRQDGNRSYVYPQSMVWSNIMKNINFFNEFISIFTAPEKSVFYMGMFSFCLSAMLGF